MFSNFQKCNELINGNLLKKIETVKEVTGLSSEVAESLLSNFNNNVQSAISYHFERNMERSWNSRKESGGNENRNMNSSVPSSVGYLPQVPEKPYSNINQRNSEGSISVTSGVPSSMGYLPQVPQNPFASIGGINHPRVPMSQEISSKQAKGSYQLQDGCPGDYYGKTETTRRNEQPSVEYFRKKEEEEGEGEEEEEGKGIPVQLLNGLVGLKREAFLSSFARICVVGRTSCGKSSLINHIISGEDRCQFVCPSGSLTTTKSVSIHKFGGKIVNEEEIKRKLKRCNERKEEGTITVYSIKNPLWKKAEFVDTPGMNDYFSTDRSTQYEDDYEKERTRNTIKNEIKDSDVVLYLVSPNDLEDEESFVKMLGMVVEWNMNIVVVITMFDKIIQERLDTSMSRREYANGVIELMEEYSKKIELFGCMVAFTQVHEPVDRRSGPYFFSDEMIYRAIKEMAFPDADSMIFLRAALFKLCKRHEWVPMILYGEKEKKRNAKKKNIAKLASVGSALVGGMVLGVGAIAIVGGVMALAVPGIGTGAGAAAITSGLAAIGGTVGGGMLAGIGVVSTVGAIAGVGATMTGAIALGFGSAHVLGRYVTKLPLSAQMTMSLLSGESGKFVGRIEISKKDWKVLEEYEKHSKIRNKREKIKYYGKDEDDWKNHTDSIFMLYREKYYFVTAVFFGPEVKFFVDVKEVVAKDD